MRRPPGQTPEQAQASGNLLSHGTMKGLPLQSVERSIQVHAALAAQSGFLHLTLKLHTHQPVGTCLCRHGKQTASAAYGLQSVLLQCLMYATNLCCAGAVTSGSDGIVKEFHEALQRSPDTAVAVAAIKV